MMENKLNAEYNSTYISLRLIDELDYTIGGYGKPNSIFIYSLNVFLEAYILNSRFFISDQEVKHLQILSSSIFPAGRPILDLLIKSNQLAAVSGIGNNIGKVVNVHKSTHNNVLSYQDAIEEFFLNGMDINIAREKYLHIPTILDSTESTNNVYLNIGKTDDGFIATVHASTPYEFYNRLCEKTKFSNIQAALPFYSYKDQIEDIKHRGLAKDIMNKLSADFVKKQSIIENYYGYSNQSIPPLVSILFSQCKTLDEIPEKMSRLRDDFTQLRDSIINYEKRIDNAETIKEQIEAINEINNFWIVFNKKYTTNSRLLYQFWEIAESSEYETAIDNLIDSNDFENITKDLNLGKVAGSSLKKIYEWYKNKKIINRFRGITDIWELFDKTPNIQNQIADFERLFKCKVNERELIELNRFAKSIKMH